MFLLLTDGNYVTSLRSWLETGWWCYCWMGCFIKKETWVLSAVAYRYIPARSA